MSAATSEKINDPIMVQELSELRKQIYTTIEHLESNVLQIRPACGAEATLAKRALQTARHWLGESLAFYDTGYRVTDNPNDPGSESKAA